MEENVRDKIICPICNVFLKKEKTKKHFKKVHFNIEINEINTQLKKIDVTFHIAESDWQSYIGHLKHKKLQPDYSYLIIREKQKIDHKCFLFSIQFDSFKKAAYFELAESKFRRLERILNLNISLIKENETLPEQIRSEVVSYEIQKTNELQAILQNYKAKTPNKLTFIKEQCETFYVTWDDISFDRNKIKISPNKAFVQAISMPGSIKIYNEIKIDYFKRKYSKDVYKMIANKGIVVEDISKGITQIRALISDHAADLENSKQKIYLKKELTDKELTGTVLQETLLKLAIKNEYLSYAAKLTTSIDKVFGMIENNNGKEEEVLLFVYQCLSTKLLLWENINPNRAAYLFVIKSNDLLSLERIKTIIKSNIEYKRYNLFIGTDTKKTFNLDCTSYYQLNHFDKFEYSQKLKLILNEHKYK